MWQAVGYTPSKLNGFDKKHSKVNIYGQRTDDYPTADREAKAMVETGPCHSAWVSEVE